MESKDASAGILDLMVRPAFCVKNGVITHVNPAAESRMLSVGTPVSELLETGKEEYAEFAGGCLYLTLNICGTVCGASVTRVQELDVFMLEQEDGQIELQAMALAAQQLRQPLASVMTVADHLFPAADSEDPAVREQIARINKGLYQMLRIVGNMSDAYRCSRETGAHQEIRDICAILDEVFEQLALAAKHADIELRFSNLRESVYCLVDAEKLDRAVSNMVANAVKFTPKGGTVNAKLIRRGRMLYLTVQDSGCGIADNLRSAVYARYQRQPGIEDGRFGIGLGMVLIRAAAAQHGGTVLMEFPENAGTRITMTLAIRQSKTAAVHSQVFRMDYAGERDHRLIELSESLPAHLYEAKKIN